MTTVAMKDETDKIRPVWEEKPSLAGQILKALVIVAIVVAVLFPFWVVIVTSFSSQEAVTRAGGLVIFPTDFTLDAYRDLLSTWTVLRALWVSVVVTVVGTIVSVTLTATAAYGLSRPGSLWHRPLLFFVLGTFLFSPGMIPTYLVVSQFGLIDTWAALVIPSAVAAFHLVVMRGFFMGIPTELIDAARIDGASDFRIFWQIVVPLSKAVIAVIALFYGVAYWGAFFNAVLYMQDNINYPIQVILRQFVLQGAAPPMGDVSVAANAMGRAAPPLLAVRMAIIVLAMLPIILIYPFAQRHFTKGVMIGAIKG